VLALRAVLIVLLAGTVLIEAGVVWTLAGGSDTEDGSRPLAAFRVLTMLAMLSIQVGLVCVWRLVTMVRRFTAFSPAALRYLDMTIGAIVSAAIVWFVATMISAPGQRDDPGVTVIMAGIGVAILGVALIVYLLRTLLAEALLRGEAPRDAT
jgi:hypothetical protein